MFASALFRDRLTDNRVKLRLRQLGPPERYLAGNPAARIMSSLDIYATGWSDWRGVHRAER
jgi:hypothetical protein